MQTLDKGSREMARLKKENAKLKKQNSRLKENLAKPTAQKKQHRRHILRKSLVILLVSAAVAVLTVANLFFWVGNTIVKQDRFVAATQPIIKDPAIQSSMALYATNSIFSNVDVQNTIENVLPPRADFLAPQLANQVKSFTKGSLQKVVASPKFQDRWNTALAKQHQRLISFASKYQGDGDISLNDVFQNLSTSLANTKLSFLAGKKLPPKVGDITVISAPWLPAFHNIVTNIDTWRLLAVIILVICLAGAVWLSSNRRRTLYIFSWATAALMVVTLITLHIIRSRILSKVDPQYAEGVQHAIQIVFHSLVLQTITIMLAGLFVGAVAWVSGPARGAAAIRRNVNLIFGGKLHDSIFGAGYGWTVWIHNHKRILEWGVVALVAAIMLLVRLTIPALFAYILLLIVLILAIEIIGGQNSKPGGPGQKTKRKEVITG
jgi:hypothetical protein